MRVTDEQATIDKTCAEQDGCAECPYEKPHGCNVHHSSYYNYACDLIEARAMLREMRNFIDTAYFVEHDDMRESRLLLEKSKEYES